MPDQITITPIGPFQASLRLPGSKSLTNRALLLAALAEGTSTLVRPLFDADDALRMLDALRRLGCNWVQDPQAKSLRVSGQGGAISASSACLDLGNAGTAYRFLTAACCLGRGAYVLDGVARMRERPIGQLVDALRQIGATIRYTGHEGFPPLEIRGGGLRGGELTLVPTLSSQYISALLLVGPYCKDGLTIRFAGAVTSRPYVEMTLGLMRHFGLEADVDPGFTRICVPPGKYRGTDYTVEPDASSASYFLAAAALVPGSRCTIEGLGKGSLQGDVGFGDLLHQMGAGLLFGGDFIAVMAPPASRKLHGIDADLNAMPDMAQTLAAVALYADGPTIIRNVGNLRVKETDRLAALETELTKLGARAEITGDDLRIEPPSSGHITVPSAGLDTYDDHRMAMSLSLVGLRVPGVRINNPGCVAKTFPQFFEYLEGLGRK